MPYKSEQQRKFMYAVEDAKKHPGKKYSKKVREAAKSMKMKAIKDYQKAAKKDMPSFTRQDRPEKVKDIYKALKQEHPGMPAAMKARIAARQGKPGKQEQGPPYKGPLTNAKNAEDAYLDGFIDTLIERGLDPGTVFE